MSHVFVLARRPVGLPQPDDFDLVELPDPALEEQQVRVEPLMISVDPYLRGRMSNARSYVAPFEVGQPITSAAIGRVVESNASTIAAGDLVRGEAPWATSYTTEASSLWRLPSDVEVNPSAYLGVLGMTGLTAYVGLVLLGQVKADDEVLVTAAGGAVGSVVGQLAKIYGARVVGSAGGADKVGGLAALGFDAGIDYRAVDFSEALSASFPRGISLFFDNVGGSQFEAALHHTKDFARVLSCGAISQYNDTELPAGPRGLEGLVVRRRLMIQGFIVSDHLARYGEYLKQAIGWVQEGKLTSLETIVDGFENLPTAFVSLFRGANVGKLLVATQPQEEG
jgi:NADPH-dependent curcumin reductase CurA